MFPEIEESHPSLRCSNVQTCELPKPKVGPKIEVQVEIHHVPTKASFSLESTSTLFKPLHSENSVKLARANQQLAEQIEVLEDHGAVKRKLKKAGTKIEVQAEVHHVPLKTSPPRIIKSRDNHVLSGRLSNNRDLQQSAEKIEVLEDQGAVQGTFYEEQHRCFFALKKLLTRPADVFKKVIRTKAQGLTETVKCIPKRPGKENPSKGKVRRFPLGKETR